MKIHGRLTRYEIEAINPRVGWFARNLDADLGRVYDYLGGGMVEYDWDNGYVTAYVDNKTVFDRSFDGATQAGQKELLEEAMRFVEGRAQ